MAKKFCPNCGTKLEANEKFCPSCGQNLQDETSTVNLDKSSPSVASNYDESFNPNAAQIDTTPFQPDSGLWENFFKTNGRLNRWRFFKRSFAIFILYMVFITADFIIFLDPTSEFGMGATGWIVFIVLTILLPIVSICLTIRRLHDLNLTGWFCLLMTIPAVNTAFWIYTTFAPGTIGPNKYGGDPLEGQR